MPLGLGPFLDQIVALLLLIAAAIGGIHLYRKTVNPSQPAQVQAAPSAAPARSAFSAEEILRGRYARGEIDRVHYLEMLQNLTAQSSGGSPKGIGPYQPKKLRVSGTPAAKSIAPSFTKSWTTSEATNNRAFRCECRKQTRQRKEH